jgi:outer membrane receptor protein involved in Fe transport
MKYLLRGAFSLLALGLSTAQADNIVEEQVLVTASRLEEDGSKLPLAWSSIDEEALAITAPVHINEIMQRVPGAWIARGNGQESLPALRSPVLTGAGSCGAFYMAMDSIALRAAGFCNVNQLFDANVEQAGRIEVIKGPATALFGSNAMHGVINILSAAPTAKLDHQVALEGGPHDYYRGRYHYRNTLGAHGVSINLNASRDGGYKDDSGYDQQKATLRHDYAGGAWDISTVLDLANLNQETAGYIEGYKSYENEDLKDTNPNPEAYRDVWSWRLHSSLSIALDEANTLTLTPFLRDNEMEFMQHYLPWQSVEENGHSSLGLRLALNTDTESLLWLNGLDLEYTDGWLKETQDDPFPSEQNPNPNLPAGIHYDYQVDALNAAAYSQVRAPLGSRWELTAGLRLEHTRYDYDNRTGDGPARAPDADDCRFFRPADRDDDFTDWSFNGGASYALTTEHTAYLRLAQGFRAPQATELYRLQGGQNVADLDSEEIDNIEFGLRGTWRQDLQYDLSVYHMNKDEVIFQDANRHNVSGARTRHYGAEVSLTYSFARDWLLQLDATAARHKYDSHMNLRGSSDDIKGNDIDTAPHIFGSTRLGWDFSRFAGRPARVELEWVYMDSYYLEPDNRHEYDGHSLLNLRFAGHLTERWRGALRMTNLLDEDYAERADFGFGEYRYFVGEPRGVYLEIAYRLGAS